MCVCQQAIVIFSILWSFTYGLQLGDIPNPSEKYILNTADSEAQIIAVHGLIERLIPQHKGAFQLTIDNDVYNEPYFEVSSVYELDKHVISIKASNGVCLAAGFYWYLREHCNCMVTWLGDNLNLPDKLPEVRTAVTKTSPYQHSYYLNVCSFGYTSSFWNWTQWERAIDWMALHGVDMPLAPIGQELIWSKVFEEIGLSSTDISNFFSGPAFLPWNRMGNIDQWMGPLPEAWLTGQVELQKRILHRMRSFGMTPVLPAFAGHVPKSMQTYAMYNLSELYWADIPNATYLMDPRDPMFVYIASTYMKHMTEVFGTDHLYSSDPFNEMIPPTNDSSYIELISKSIFDGMASVDPKATWILQGWSFLRRSWFWQEPQLTAFFAGVPKERLVILDLWAEVDPLWSKDPVGFYGQQLIWNIIHNFGGRSGLYGTLPRMNEGVTSCLNNPNVTLYGIGAAPEEISTNPIVYELWSDLRWTTEPLDLDVWVEKFTEQRYGVLNSNMLRAWSILQNTVYNCTTTQQGASGAIIAARPDFVIPNADCCAPTALYYDPNELVVAWKYFMDSMEDAELNGTETYLVDLAEVTRQVLSDFSLELLSDFSNEYNTTRNMESLKNISSTFLEVILSMEDLMRTQKYYLLGTWLSDAETWASSTNEKSFYQSNARKQVTTWGPKGSELHDYAYKLWSGLLKDFYFERWHMFFDQVLTSVQSNTEFDYQQFLDACLDFEEEWTNQNTEYDTEPTGSTIDSVKKIRETFQGYFLEASQKT